MQSYPFQRVCVALLGACAFDMEAILEGDFLRRVTATGLGEA